MVFRGIFSNWPGGRGDSGHKVSSPKRCGYVTCMYDLGEAKEKKGELGEAISCWTRAILVAQRQRSCDIETARALDSVGDKFTKHGRWDEALAAWNEMLNVQKRYLRTDWHPEVARTLNKIGVALSRIRNGSDHTYSALMAFEKALEMQQDTLGPGHEDCVETTQNMFKLLQGFRQREQREEDELSESGSKEEEEER
uniref:Kinesin light chain n=1 Tax=Trieres chinensis TaxID=1514140 RepID=A0A7S1ZJ33_TRICV|mmetsp:Transcript_26849/g.54968  ORF Transcript_26849/g.54968 Transcript_26849/m.54968 type:complete len:197 (+) Transcript_26849:237-827(+)|eukprot:CAMPEP_0183292080 /NCGR_PEP_ID=MMETSP0160_2-20130417/1280_1 /TAXON_ID=2839 ORGANISM="Odontella Sinensis, Strain Grunow 1884" /NCGR_SAMPLE_ID=MMETSP0160_2 /ASSEMBLY_ACC=CAM_ASM_000250 /LENGTH=196 /DNA_ID=CAMNT_0025452989 /DNA_START=237 /DNA_END=827 /DNA_ORIENTATION=+